MTNHVIERMYKAIPFSMACELHQRLKSGCLSPETRKMLQEALKMSGIAKRAA